MVKGYVGNEMFEKALDLFEQIDIELGDVFEEMNEKGIIPDEIGWNILIGACSKSGMLHHCQYIANQIPLNIQNKIRTQNALIDMW
ncbi:unnamed protein product, partial [Rotaria magnacalcarata]